MYDECSPGYTGRCTAPLLVDRLQRRIVSNESAGIVRGLNRVRLPGCTDVDLVPAALRPDIDAVNELVYDKVGCPPGAPVTRAVGVRVAGSMVDEEEEGGVSPRLRAGWSQWCRRFTGWMTKRARSASEARA